MPQRGVDLTQFAGEAALVDAAQLIEQYARRATVEFHAASSAARRLPKASRPKGM